MEIKISTKQILNVLYILSWLIFVGICIDTGGVLSNALYAFFFNSAIAKNFWSGLDLSSLFQFDCGYFLVETFLMSIVGIMKAIMFYLIIKLIHDKKLNLLQPFSKEVRKFIFNLAFLTFGIGLFSSWAVKYAEWFESKGVIMPDINLLKIDGAGVWLFMSIVLFIIAQIFKRGIEIQEENELTV
jgi:uncharacterized membrane protein